MPLYEYACLSCGRHVEMPVVVADRDSVRRRCPHCADLNHAVTLVRVITAPAIRGATVARS